LRLPEKPRGSPAQQKDPPRRGLRLVTAIITDIQTTLPGHPHKSGLMLGLSESFDKVVDVLKDLRAHDCDRLTIGQYLQRGLAGSR